METCRKLARFFSQGTKYYPTYCIPLQLLITAEFLDRKNEKFWKKTIQTRYFQKVRKLLNNKQVSEV